MKWLRSDRRNLHSVTKLQFTRKFNRQTAVLAAFALAALPCLAQDSPQPADAQSSQSSQSQPGQSQPSQSQTAANRSPVLIIPAGTQIALVLTHPVQSRYVRHGDDIYAQISAPVDSGDQLAIPPGTFVQGKVDKVEQRNGRGELHLASMSITFPDGYVAPVQGPMTLESNQGYAIKDPGNKRMVGAFAMPAAGAGLGAIIGHSVGGSPNTITSTLPPGCTGPPPGCLTSSVTGPSNTGRNTIIGAGIGGAIGAVASITLLFSSHHFFLDVGTPVEMTLEQPLSLQQDEVVAAVQQSAQHPAAAMPAASRPLPPLNRGTCYTPGTPGTPATVIPGVPGANGVPGPPTIIPGSPPIPGTPYPCP